MVVVVYEGLVYTAVVDVYTRVVFAMVVVATGGRVVRDVVRGGAVVRDVVRVDVVRVEVLVAVVRDELRVAVVSTGLRVVVAAPEWWEVVLLFCEELLLGEVISMLEAVVLI